MKRAFIAGGALAILLLLLALAAGRQAPGQDRDHPPAATSPSTPAASEACPELLYGRVTTDDGATYEGRLRFGGDEEAVWADHFNGAKKENPWIVHAPEERRPRKILGLEFSRGKRTIDGYRRFIARFGDIARIEADALTVRVFLKGGAVIDLARLDQGDFDDGVRVWDARRGVVDLGTRQILAIEMLPAPGSAGEAPYRLHGTVRTRQGGDFSGFVQWNRRQRLGADELDGQSAEGPVRLRFDNIRSIARSGDRSLVTLLAGREIVLSADDEDGRVYVDDLRYGRVLITWEAFERLDFDSGSSGPDYDDFPPGGPLTGSVTTRSGRRLAGRLVYDLDESDVVETLDAPSRGVDYTIPFGLVASIVPHGGEAGVRVTLHDGEELQLERDGDLGERNAGMLVFVDGAPGPEYVPWSDVEEIDLDRPKAMYPPPRQG